MCLCFVLTHSTGPKQDPLRSQIEALRPVSTYNTAASNSGRTRNDQSHRRTHQLSCGLSALLLHHPVIC